MAKPIHLADLVNLPRLDANGAQVLAKALIGTAHDEQGQLRPLPPTAALAIQAMRAAREVLQVELDREPPPPAEVREVDLLEDTSVRALHQFLAAWGLLANLIPEGDLGHELDERLFGEGLSFITLKPREEWGIVDTKLQTIQREGLEAPLRRLGAGPMLDFLRRVHERYGRVTGATQALPQPESPQVRALRTALTDEIQTYVAAVVGSVRREQPETRALAELLLQPLIELRKELQRRRRRRDEDPTDQG